MIWKIIIVVAAKLIGKTAKLEFLTNTIMNWRHEMTKEINIEKTFKYQLTRVVTPEFIARAWASMDGKLDLFDKCKTDPELEEVEGCYEGYITDTKELLERAHKFEEQAGKANDCPNTKDKALET